MECVRPSLDARDQRKCRNRKKCKKFKRRVCKGSSEGKDPKETSREMVTILIGSEGQKTIPGTSDFPGLPTCFTSTEYSYIHLAKYKRVKVLDVNTCGPWEPSRQVLNSLVLDTIETLMETV